MLNIFKCRTEGCRFAIVSCSLGDAKSENIEKYFFSHFKSTCGQFHTQTYFSNTFHWNVIVAHLRNQCLQYSAHNTSSFLRTCREMSCLKSFSFIFISVNDDMFSTCALWWPVEIVSMAWTQMWTTLRLAIFLAEVKVTCNVELHAVRHGAMCTKCYQKGQSSKYKASVFAPMLNYRTCKVYRCRIWTLMGLSNFWK